MRPIRYGESDTLFRLYKVYAYLGVGEKLKAQAGFTYDIVVLARPFYRQLVVVRTSLLRRARGQVRDRRVKCAVFIRTLHCGCQRSLPQSFMTEILWDHIGTYWLFGMPPPKFR